MKYKAWKKCGAWCLNYPAKVTVCFKRWKIGDSVNKPVLCCRYIEIE